MFTPAPAGGAALRRATGVHDLGGPVLKPAPTRTGFKPCRGRCLHRPPPEVLHTGALFAFSRLVPRHHPPRLPPSEYLGLRRYFVTACTPHRRPFFTIATVATVTIDQLRACSARQMFAVIAYCLMPDHAHLLVEGQADDSDLQAFVHAWKLRSSFHTRPQVGGPLWQRGYYEHTLRSDESTIDVARYVLANPVRAGLVAYPTEYVWVGSFTTTVQALLEAVQDEGAAPA